MGLFKILEAGVKTVTALPIAVVQDVVTLGGSVNDKKKPYTQEVLEDIAQDIDEIGD